ncbi:RNA-binding protein RO60 [Amyelois transitella]|uniref:RNA-binding protein RO60 n=1 Tax=Amyelois transitella TaxID=680683 RepID=UPI00067B1EAD|nr:RNA-binding protein RO60 [Amyelois transitella]
MSKKPLDPALRNRFTRFLHTGTENPIYYPGCWTAHNYFDKTKLPVVEDIYADPEYDMSELTEIVVKAFTDDWYTRYDTLAFSLVKIINVGQQKHKEAAYKAAAVICVTPEQMMLFNKYTRVLKTGNGRGWCKNVQEWYLKKEPIELAGEITRVRGRHGRSHKTLLRKSHVKIPAEDHARDAVVKYAIFGFKKAKQLVGDSPGTKEIFEIIQRVEKMRVCEDAVAAAAMAAQYKFTLDHVPGHLLTSQDVWNAVLPQMTLEELLHNIQRIHNMGFLTNESTTNAILISLLNHPDVIKKSKVTALAVYIALCNYKQKSRPLKYEKAKVSAEKESRRRTRQMYDSKTGTWEWTVTKRHPKEVKHWGIDKLPNPAVIAALNKLIDMTWLLTPPTKARYMITMDMRHHMFKGRHFCKSFTVPKKVKKTTAQSTPGGSGGGGGGGDADTEKKNKKKLHAECFYNRHVTPGHAAIIIALQLLKRETDVKLAIFTEGGVELVSIERNFSTIDEAEFVLRQKVNLGRVQLDAPIEWASKNNVPIDVFINMVDRPTRFTELDRTERGGRGPGGRYGPPPSPESKLVDHCPVRALERYRQNSGVEEAKLIVMSLASHRVATTDGTHEGVLDIVGIDEYVPKLMDAFVLGQFK